jgi:hypothetical protein
VPQTATVWAACSQSDLIPGDGAVPAAGRRADRKRRGRALFGADSFDIVLVDESDEGGQGKAAAGAGVLGGVHAGLREAGSQR